jgi:hypothetical protein
MRVNEIKEKLSFYADAMLQSGFQLGWNSILEEIETISDSEWNNGNKATAEVLRKLAKDLRDGE